MTARRTLKYSKDFITSLLQLSPDVVIIIDNRGVIWEANEIAARMCAQSSSKSLKGKSIQTFFQFPDDVSSLCKTSDHHPFPITTKTKTKPATSLKGTISVVSDESQKVSAYILQLTAISQPLKFQQEQYPSFSRRQLLTSPSDYIYTVIFQDDQSVTTIHGTGSTSITGYTSEEYQQNPNLWIQMVHPEDHDKLYQQIADLKNGKPYSLEHRIFHKSGAERWVRNTPIVRYDTDGKLSAYDGIITDITDQKLIEAALRESERNYRDIFDSTSEAILVHDAHSGKITDVNESVLHMFEYSRTEIINLSLAAMSAVQDDMTDNKLAERLQRTIVEGPQIFEWQAKKKNGTLFWTETTLRRTSIRGRDCILAVVRDITERRQVQERQRQYAQRLEALLAIDHDILAAESTGAIAQNAVKRIRKILECERTSLTVYDFQRKEALIIAADADRPTKLETGAHFPLELLYNPSEQQEEDYIFVADLRELKTRSIIHDQLISEGIYCWLRIPLRVEGKIIGLINLGATAVGSFDKEKIKIACEIAIPLAVAIQQSQLRDDIKRYMRELEHTVADLRFTQFAIDHAADSIFWIDTEGSFVYFNETACKNLGYSEGEFRRLTIFNIEITLQAEKWRDLLDMLKKNQYLIFETYHRRKDGFRFPVEVITNYLDFHGKEYVCAFARDISERRKSETALKESEERYRTLIERLEDGIFRYLPNGKFLDVNPAMVRIFGYESREEFMNIHWHELFFGLKDEIDASKEINSTGKTIIRQKRKDDTEVWAEIHGHVVRDDNGEALYHEGLLRDITDRIQKERALRESEERFRIVTEQTGFLVYDYDLRTGRLVWSGAISELTGYSNEETQMLDVNRWREHLHPDDRDETICLIENARENGERFHKEYRFRRKDGSYFYCEDDGIFLRNDRGEIYRMLGTQKDISERKKAEEERALLEEQLQQAIKMEAIGRLAGGIAHDFNNLLTGVLGNVELAHKLAPTGTPIRDRLNQIEEAAERAAGLVRQLLAFSRKQVIEPKIVDLNELIQNFRKMLVRIIGEDIDLQTPVCSGIGKVSVDPGQIEQIIVNLSVNARDAMPNGGRLLVETDEMTPDEEFCAQHPSLKPQRYVALAISDTGEGIPEDHLSHIFEPFYTTKPKGKGTGLGLSTVLGIVQQHDGYIDVHSEIHQGTTFTIYFPTVETDDLTAEDRSESDKTETGSEVILIVEDNEAVLDLARNFLSNAGHTVLVANGASQCFEILEQYHGPVDLLLADVVMPDMNGKELYNKLKEKYANLKVVFMSGYTDDIITDHGVLDEGVQFIQKPFSMHSLTHKIREALDINK